MILLERFCNGPPGIGTFGRLTVGVYSCYTVEREWADNAPFLSCLPAAVYRLEPFLSARFGKTYVLTNATLGVTGDRMPHSRRWACIIHPGNITDHVRGCIAPGKRLSAFRDPDKSGADPQWAVTDSALTFAELIPAITGLGDFELGIVYRPVTMPQAVTAA